MDLLISQVADEHGLEVEGRLGSVVPSGAVAAAHEHDELTERLAKYVTSYSILTA